MTKLPYKDLGLPIHPLANLIRPHTPEELKSLEESTLASGGNRVPIVMLDGMILDGRGRMHACVKNKLVPQCRKYDPAKDGPDPIQFVLDQNMHLRHLTNEDKKLSARAIMAHNPTLTDSAVAKMVQMDPKTIKTYREELVALGAIPQTETRTTADGRTRNAPPPTTAKNKDSSPEGEQEKAPPKEDSSPYDNHDNHDSQDPIETNDVIDDAGGKIVRDANGDPVPEDLEDIFLDKIHAQVIDVMETFLTRMQGNPHCYVRYRINNVGIKLAQGILDCVRFHRPHIICPECSGKGCETCYATGFVSYGQAQEWEAIDEE